MQEQEEHSAQKPSSFGHSLVRFTHPVASAIGKLVPKSVIEKAIIKTDEIAARSRYEREHDQDDLQAAHEAARKIERHARRLNGSTGAAAGLGGAWAASADIPLSSGVAMRNIRDTSSAYGYS